MTSKSTLLTYWALSGMLLLPAVGVAGKANQNDTTEKGSKVRKITGCLSKGDSSNEYQVNTPNGATWEVKSDAVDLASHVGHTVTVTGTVNNAMATGLRKKRKIRPWTTRMNTAT